MRKFLIVLMVVAMASFLFVGCMPDGVTPPVDEDEDEDVELPVSTTPVIRGIGGIESLYSSDTQYINEDEAEDGILVTGFAPKYSEVNVYIDGVIVGTSTTYGVLEWFTVFVDEDGLGVDGEKTLYATAKEVGLDISAPSTTYAFTLDVVAPEMVKVAAKTSAEYKGTVTVTFDEAVDEDIAEDEKNWTIKPIQYNEIDISTAELISAKVVELEFDHWYLSEGTLIRVSCDTIEDLAGNKAADLFGYCYSEVEEVEVVEPAANEAPVITSAVINSGKATERYTYTVVAEDPDGDDLTYSLAAKPDDLMTINEDTGKITWFPANAGSFNGTIEVSDGYLSDTQDFTITVGASVLDEFRFDAIDSQVSGVAFEVTISAWARPTGDYFPYTDYVGTGGILSVSDGSDATIETIVPIIIDAGDFIAGVWTGEVTITTDADEDLTTMVITILADDKSGASLTFTVTPE